MSYERKIAETPTTLKGLVKATIETARKNNILINKFLNPNTLDMIAQQNSDQEKPHQTLEVSTADLNTDLEANLDSDPSEELEEYLKNVRTCERPLGYERVWVLSQSDAHQFIQNFDKSQLAKEGVISAQTSFNSGENVEQAALDDSFGENKEYLDYYRIGNLPEEVLQLLPEVFKNIKKQQLPDCSDPLTNPVQNPVDHSRLMIGDVILIAQIVEGRIIFRTVHFVVGNDTKVYKTIRETKPAIN
jgi:hypothetical protein